MRPEPPALGADASISGGRWIRPEREPASRPGETVAKDRRPGVAPREDSSIEQALFEEVSERVAQLLALERELEERLRARVREVEVMLGEREARLEEELAIREADARAAAEEALLEARKEGRDRGFREGFDRGAEEGRRLGFEQGRLEGIEEGKRVGRQSEESRWRRKTAEAVEVFARLAGEFRASRERLLRDAQGNIVELSVRIAEKVIDRELRFDPRAALGTARKAVEQIFRGCEVVLQVHPGDAAVVRDVLDRHPRWAEDLASIEVRPSEDVERGGCRLLSGAGIVDATISSQLELIEEALRRAIDTWVIPSAASELDTILPANSENATREIDIASLRRSRPKASEGEKP